MSSSLERALDLVAIVVERGDSMTLAELAGAAQLPKPTAHRLLRTLIGRGYVRQDGRGSYEIGPELLSLSGKALSRLKFAQEAGPHLQRLQLTTPETIHFGLLTGTEATYIEKREGRRPYRMASVVGTRLPLHCTAIGKSILAFLADDVRTPLLREDRLVRRTERTVTQPEQLRKELDLIAKRAYAIDDEENEANIRCVGAPVFDGRGGVIGAISVSAPAFQFSRREAAGLAPAVMGAACSLSLDLGMQADRLPPAYRRLSDGASGQGEPVRETVSHRGRTADG